MKQKQQILIISYFFYPENTPRAFRTFELAKSFSKKGYNVNLLIPDYKYDYSEIKRTYNFNIIKIKTGFFRNKNAKKKQTSSKISPKTPNRFLKIIFRSIYMGGNAFEYFIYIFKYLIKEKNKYKCILSVGLPISVHLGSILGFKFNKKITKKIIGDFGDPFLPSGGFKLFMYIQKKIYKYIIRSFDKIIIPTNKSLSHYTKITEKEIEVIPQSISIDEVKTSEYTGNIIPSFAYAGVFYEEYRNPEVLIKYLSKLNINFQFDLYTDTKSKLIHRLLNKYPNIKDKVNLIPLVDRYECIKLLSTYDFLINIENLNSIQVPSKFIDYYLAKRPVYSFSQESFNPEKFNNFLTKKNTDIVAINIKDYDTNNIINKFLKICNE